MEINNPINFIRGNLQHARQYIQELFNCVELYQQHYPDSAEEIRQYWTDTELEFTLDDFPKMFASMQVGTERIRDIVTSLRNFS